MRVTDEKYLILKRTRSDLEAYSYKLKRNLSDDGPWAPFCEEPLRQQLIDESIKAIAMLDDDENTPLLELTEKLAHFRKHGDPTEQRAKFYEQFPEIERAYQKLEEAMMTKANTNGNLSQAQRDEVAAKLKVYADILAAVKAELNSQPLYKNASRTLDEMYAKLETLKGTVDTIASSTVPTPKEQDTKMHEAAVGGDEPS